MTTETISPNGLHPAAAASIAEREAPTLTISRIKTKTLIIPITGTAPLIMHKFSEKAKRQMLEAQQGIKNPRQNRDPDADYEASFYRLASQDGDPKRYGFPSIGFKAAAVSAARYFGKDVKMTELRQVLFVQGELTPADDQPLVEIFGEPVMREDIVRLSISSTDLRYRAAFFPWSATLEVRFVSSMLSADSVLSLFDAAGMGVGVGEWRPERRGEMGTFTIAPDRQVEIID